MSTEVRRIQFDFIARDRGVSRQMEETGQAAEDMNQGLEDGSGKAGKFGAMAAKLGPILGAVAGAAALIAPAVAKGLDAEAATAKFQAQLGLTAKESERIGGVAGKLYSSAYGESMEEVRGAITQVIRNMDGMANASSADLKQTTARAMDLATVMDEDVSRVTVAVSQLMRTGLARNSKEAFDIMTRGAQLGANKAEDLADTMEEYGVQFKNMGLDGKQAMGLIVQGLQAGGRNADLVADTIKEFSIEAVAGGERVGKGFKNLGLNAGEMSKAFAKGGPGAAKALDAILDKLRAIKDPVKRNQVAIELFGTKAEDMGKALFALDPSEATKKLGLLEGATDRAGKALGDTFKAKLTGFKRRMEMEVTEAGGRALNVLSKLGGEVRKGFQIKGGAKAANDTQRLGIVLKKIGDVVQKDVVPAFRDFGDWVNKKIAPVLTKFYSRILKEVFKQFEKISGSLRGNSAELGALAKAVGKVIEILYKVLAPVLGFVAKILINVLGTAIRIQINILAFFVKHAIKAWNIMSSGAKVISRWAKDSGKSFNGFRDVAVRILAQIGKNFASFVSGLVRGAAKAFGWVPGLGPKLKAASRAVDGWASNFNRKMDGLKGKNVNVRVYAKGSFASAMQASKSLNFQTGGRVPWVSGARANEDSVPALLVPEEHVVTKQEVQAAGGHDAVKRIRAAMLRGDMKGYVAGGRVTQGLPSRGATDALVHRQGMAHQLLKPRAAAYEMAKVLAQVWAKFAASGGPVVAAARSMIGYPYSWGGGGRGGPSLGIGRGSGTYGFDCSGLTEYAWWKGARVGIGGVTYSQHPNSRPIGGPRPGALGFNASLGHVVLGSNKPGYVIEAPYTGGFVREVRKSMPDWRWPRGASTTAGLALGGPVQRMAQRAVDYGGASPWKRAMVAQVAGDPGRRRARGGHVGAATPYLVGERGPEVMVPHRAGVIHGSGTKVVTVHQNIKVEIKVPPGANKAEIGREMNECLLEYKRRGGKLATAR